MRFLRSGLRARLPLLAIALAAITLFLLAVAHTPPVRARVQQAAIAWLRTHAGITASIDELSYDLLRLDVRLQGLRLSAVDSPTPFFFARRVRIDVPWSAILGAPRLQTIELDEPVVSIVRDASGSSNLPGTTGTDGAFITRLPIGRLQVTRARLTYEDETNDIRATASDVNLTLSPTAHGTIEGPLAVGAGPSLRAGDLAMDGTIGGTVSYDGESIALSTVRLALPPGRLVLDGRIGLFGASPDLQLSLTGAWRLEEASALLHVAPPATGLVSLNGIVDGSVAAPAAALTLTGQTVSWHDIALTDLDVRLRAARDAVLLERTTAQVAGGTLTATGRLPLDTLRAVARVDATGLTLETLAGNAMPVPLAATVAGRADLEADLHAGLSGLSVTADIRAESTSHRRGRVGLDGAAALQVADGRWHVREEASLSKAVTIKGDVNGRLAVSALGDSTLTGNLAASVPALAPLVAVLNELGWTPPSSLLPASGHAELALRVDGTLAAPSAAGRFLADDVRLGDVRAVAARSDLVLDARRVRLDDVQVTAGRSSIVGQAAMDLPSGRLRGDLSAVLADLSALDSRAAQWNVDGRTGVRITLAGTRKEPIVRANLSAPALRIAGQRPVDLEAHVNYDGDTVTADDVEVRFFNAGRLNASGSYNVSNGRHTLKVLATAVPLTPIEGTDAHWPVSAAFDGRLDSRGTVERPEGGGRFDISALEWDGMTVGAAGADVNLSPSGVGIDLRLPALSLTANALVEPRPPYDGTLRIVADDVPIDALLRALGDRAPPGLDRLAGTFSFTARAAGRLDDLSTVTADAALERLDLRMDEARLALERPAAARYTASTLAVDDMRLRTGGTTVDVGGAIAPTSDGGLTVSLIGELADLRPWLTAAGAPPEVALEGALKTSLRAAGSMDRIRLTADARLDGGRLEWPGYPAVTGMATHASLTSGIVDVPSLSARWQDVDLESRLRIPLPFLSRWLPQAVLADVVGTDTTATLSGRLSNVTPSVAAPFVGADTLDVLTGRAEVGVTLRADAPALDHVTGELIVTELSGSVAHVPVEQMQPTQLALDNGRLRVVGWTWNVAGSHVGVSGSADVTGDRALDLRADGRLDLRVLGLFAPSATTGGTGDLAVAIRGRADKPLADGTVELTNAELRLTQPEIGISGATGTIRLSPTRLDAGTITGAVNGGRFSLRGGVDYTGFVVTGGELSIDADGVALDVPAGFRTQIDARLRAALGDRIALGGRVDIVRGAYRDPISLAAVVADAARRRDLADAPAEEDTLARRVDLDVAVTSTEDLILDNNYGRMDLGLDVRVVGTAAAPSVVGRAAVREGGVLYLGGRTYLVERGLIDFSNPRSIEPELDLSARTRVRGTDENNAPTDYDVTLGVTGSPDTLETSLTSDPPRSQADIVSLLATGRLADQAGGAGTAVARDQVLGYLSGEALGFAARAVGLDAIRFEQGVNVDALQADPSIAGEINPAQRLTVSRRVSRLVDVTVSQNLRDTGLLTWIVTFAPRRAIEVRTVSRDDRSRSYELRHDLFFGGPPTPRLTRTVSPASRVGDIRFSGNTVVPAAQLLSRLTLRVGDRFDFYRWQRDRDRLRAFFLGRGFLEARVSARQTATTVATHGTRVGLEYDIDPGASTTLEIAGYRLPDETTRELETLWSNAVVPFAVAADMRALLTTRLAERGYLRSTVEVERRLAPGGAVVMHVQIDPGPQSTSRRISIEGNQQFSTIAIETLAARHGIDGWLRPKALGEAVAMEYRQQGLLNASITAGPLKFDAETAVLPIRISEGLPFHLDQVSIDGVRNRAYGSVERDLGLAGGAPYRPDDIEQARRRLRRGYASDGFAAMSERTRTTVDRARSTVDVAVVVDEGPRQVVDQIDVVGADDVGARVVTQTLGVQPGASVDADAWSVGRRRLMQTGLFRRVDFTTTPLTVDAAAPGLEPVRLDVTVVRRTPWRLRYGIDVTDESAPLAERGRLFGGGVNANLERFGLFGRPGTAGLALRYNGDHRVARGVVTWPSFFGQPLASRLFLSRSRDSVKGENILAFITDKAVVTAEQRFQPFAKTQVAYAYQFEQNHVFDPRPDPDDPFAIDERWRQARLTSSIVIDTRNDPLDPRSGLLHSSNLEFGLEVLGRNGRFIKYSAQQFVFRELFPRRVGRGTPGRLGSGAGLVSASGARLSLGRGFGQDLIVSERFYAGGANTVRGYPEDALGGLDFFGEPIPGQATVVLNQELRFPLYRWVRGVAFIDAGNVFTRVDDLSLGSLKVGSGFGLRFATPLGLLRLDAATPVPADGRPFKYSFSFGHIF